MKNHRSDDEWRRLLEAQQQSGLNQTQFCKRQQITRSTFFNAKKRLSPYVNNPAFISVSSFTAAPRQPIPLAIEPAATSVDEPPSSLAGFLILTMPHCSLQFPASISPFWLATLLRELTP